MWCVTENDALPFSLLSSNQRVRLPILWFCWNNFRESYFLNARKAGDAENVERENTGNEIAAQHLGVENERHENDRKAEYGKVHIDIFSNCKTCILYQCDLALDNSSCCIFGRISIEAGAAFCISA